MKSCLVVLLSLSLSAAAPDWIPQRCCVTNGCCFEVGLRDVIPLPGDRWRIVASGETVGRAGFSEDGKFWRCACDYDAVQSRYIAHDRARTYCLFVPRLMGNYLTER